MTKTLPGNTCHLQGGREMEAKWQSLMAEVTVKNSFRENPFSKITQ